MPMDEDDDALLQDALQEMLRTEAPLNDPVKQHRADTSDAPDAGATGADRHDISAWCCRDTDDDGATEAAATAPPQSSSPRPQTTAQRCPVRTRRRRKDEIEYLRCKANDLEAELEQLKHRVHPTRRCHGSSSAAASSASIGLGTRGAWKRVEPPLNAVWERIAQHQLEQKREAEMENIKLREQLEVQLKIARGLERLLRKRPCAEVVEANERHPTRKRPRSGQAGEDSDEQDHEAALAAVYQGLSGHVDQLLGDVDDVLQRCGLAAVETDLKQVHTCNDSSNGLQIELRHAIVLPFAFEAVGAAVWQCLSMDHVKLANGYYGAIDVSPDRITARAMVTLRVRRAEVDIHVKFVIKRIVEAHRHVYAWSSVADHEGCTGFGGLKSMQFRETSWSVVAPLQSGGLDAPPQTVMRACARMTNDVSIESMADHDRVRLLTDVAFASYDQCSAVLHQTIENLLIEASLGHAHAT